MVEQRVSENPLELDHRKILQSIFVDNYELLVQMQLNVEESENINWLATQPDDTDLDNRISPLACAAFFGRKRIVELLLENSALDLNLPTDDNEYSPLCCACMAGQYEVVTLLAENGANVNYMNSIGQTPLIHCFSRLSETENTFENKNICLKIASVLLSNGADINKYSLSQTYLHHFCSVTIKMDPIQLQTNFQVIEFLLQHGADPYLENSMTGKNCFQMAENHHSSQEVLHLLSNTKQTFFHEVARDEGEADCVVEDTGINVGCCSLFSAFSFCRYT